MAKSMNRESCEVPVELLRDIWNALDQALGDTDADWYETDAERRREDPVLWAAQQIADLIWYRGKREPDDTRDREPSETACELVERVVEKSEKARESAVTCTGPPNYERAVLDRDNAKAALLEYIGELEAGDDEPTPIELTEEEWEAAVEWAKNDSARHLVRNVLLTALDAVNELRTKHGDKGA